MSLVSCRPSMTDITDFDITQEITSYDSLFSDKGSPFGVIMGIEIKNGIIVAEHRNDEYNFTFIDASTGRLLKRWGRIGEGTNEYLDFGNGFILNDSSIIFLERMKKTIHLVSVSKILAGRDSVGISEETYPYNVDFRPLLFCNVGEGKIFAGGFKTGRLGVINSKDEIVDCPFEYPFSTEPLDGISRGSVFQCKIKSNERQKRVVVQTLTSDIFEIYQYSDTAFNRVSISTFNHPPQISGNDNRYGIDYNESIAGLMKMAVTDSLIYFTYSSLISNEMERLGDSSNEILCFNWNGEKVKKYILPFPISSFCVDDRYIYGVRNNEDIISIYRFKL